MDACGDNLRQHLRARKEMKMEAKTDFPTQLIARQATVCWPSDEEAWRFRTLLGRPGRYYDELEGIPMAVDDDQTVWSYCEGRLNPFGMLTESLLTRTREEGDDEYWVHVYSEYLRVSWEPNKGLWQPAQKIVSIWYSSGHVHDQENGRWNPEASDNDLPLKVYALSRD